MQSLLGTGIGGMDMKQYYGWDWCAAEVRWLEMVVNLDEQTSMMAAGGGGLICLQTFDAVVCLDIALK